MSTPPELYRSFELLFGASPDAVAIAGGADIVYANAACERLYGYTDPAQYLGRPFLELIAPSSHALVLELVRRRAMGEPVPAVYRVRSLRADGSEFDNEIRSTTTLHAGALYFIVLQREVVEPAKRPEITSDLYRAIFDVNSAIKLLIDPATGAIVDANEPALEFYGWSLAQLRTMHITDINQLSQAEVQEEMRNARTGKRRYFRFRHRTARGDVRHVEVHSGPIDTEQGQLLLSIIHDVTERDALEAQLRASQQLEAVGRLAGGVAHEFNNLLTVLLNGSAIALRKIEPDSPVRRYLEDMSFAARRAADLTRDLLAFSRRQVTTAEPTSVNAVVERMGGMLQRSSGSAHAIVTDTTPELGETVIDPRQLEHVVMNLVLNARDAMPEGGTITIATDVYESNVDDSVPPGRWVRLQVRDEGHGMDPETQRRIFEPFFTTKAGGQGTGLGMATVFGIVAQTEGHIRIQSEVGVGTTISIYLPLHTGQAVDAEAPQPDERGLEATVLLVDDMDSVRRSLAETLTTLGCRVLQASSGADAIAALAREGNHIDVVITDVVMPQMSGIELTQRILAAHPGLPVLVIFGDLRNHSLADLPDRVGRLQKPIEPERLSEELRRLLGEASARPPA